MQLYISRASMGRLKSSVHQVCIMEMQHRKNRMQQTIMRRAGALRAGRRQLRKR